MVWILDLYIIMAANIRFDSVNPFNEYPIWSMNDYTQILANWRSYHRQYRAPQLQYYTYHSFPAVAQFTLHMPGSNFQNLINHSSYFAGLQRLQQTQIQPQMSFTIKSDPFVPLPIGLSAHLISLNSRPVPTLPDFRIVNIHDFVNICIFYNFDLMLDQMLNFSLDTGLHYFPQFFRHLYKNMPRNDPLCVFISSGLPHYLEWGSTGAVGRLFSSPTSNWTSFLGTMGWNSIPTFSHSPGIGPIPHTIPNKKA